MAKIYRSNKENMKMKTMTQSLIEDAKAKVEQSAQEWSKENLPKIDEVVRTILDRRVDEIICKLLGFDNRYGDGWEVDHCNGRNGNSAAGDWIREKAGETVQQWLTEQAGKLPDLPKKAIASLRAEYMDALQYELHKLLREKAFADAKEKVNQIIYSTIEEAMK